MLAVVLEYTILLINSCMRYSLTFVKLHVIYFYVVFLVSQVKTEKEKHNIELVLST